MLAGCGEGGWASHGETLGLQVGSHIPATSPPRAVAQWWGRSGVLLNSEQLAHPQQGWREARRHEQTGEQSQRGQEDRGGQAGMAAREQPPAVLLRLLTCIASFNLPFPGELGALSTLCSAGTGAQSSQGTGEEAPRPAQPEEESGKSPSLPPGPPSTPAGLQGACPRIAGPQDHRQSQGVWRTGQRELAHVNPTSWIHLLTTIYL